METGTDKDEQIYVATVDDLQDVIAMCGDVYEGIDYLQYDFATLVNGPGFKSFLYKRAGELVAFASTKIQDEGQSLLIMAARVKESCRGLGVYGRFRRRLFQQFADHSKYPRLHLEMMTVNAFNTDSNKEKMRRSGFHQVLVKYNAMQLFEASSLSNLTVEASNHRVTLLTRNDLEQLFQANPSKWQHLFPQKRLTIGWKPCLIMADNLDSLLRTQNIQFYGTKTSNCEYTLLTVGSYYFCKLGISYHVDVFGIAGSQELKDHIDAHLQRLKRLCNTLSANVLFNVFTSEEPQDVLVADAARQLNAFKPDQLKAHTKMYLWEREITELAQPDQ